MFILKAYPGQWVSLSHKLDKPFPYVSRFHAVPLASNFSIAPKSTRVISLLPSKPQTEFSKGTNFSLHRTIRDSGVFTFNVQCMHAEKQLPILLNNPNSHHITLNKGTLGFISHDLSSKNATQKNFRITDNVAFIESKAGCAEELQSFFEVCSVPQSIEHVNHIAESESIGQLDFDELPTDFSEEAKSLKPEASHLKEAPIWSKEDVQESISGFSKKDQEFLLKFDFSQTDLTPDEFALPTRILIEDQDVYSKFQYDVGRIKQEFSVKLKPGSELKRQRPSKVPLHYRDK